MHLYRTEINCTRRYPISVMQNYAVLQCFIKMISLCNNDTKHITGTHIKMMYVEISKAILKYRAILPLLEIKF